MTIERRIESNKLKKQCELGRAALVAIYGRRRIGKTFFVREFLKKNASSCLAMQFTGTTKTKTIDQIKNFTFALEEWLGHIPSIMPLSWTDVFIELRRAFIAASKHYPDSKIVLFIDELPWAAENDVNSEFMASFAHFFNDFFDRMNNAICIVAGSSATWMLTQFIGNKGPLHARITEKIMMRPFTLLETQRYLTGIGFELDRKSICDIYMCTGGVAKYLTYFRSDESVSQNIHRIFFTIDGGMSGEYHEILQSLFGEGGLHSEVISALSSKGASHGFNRKEIAERIGKGVTNTNTRLIAALNDLEASNFIMVSHKLGTTERYPLYRLSDPYCHFYNQWLAKLSRNDMMRLSGNHWGDIYSSQNWNIWAGHAFENIAHLHLDQYLTSRGILGVGAKVYYWKYIAPKGSGETGAEIDMLVERENNTYDIVECKYYSGLYELPIGYADNLTNKVNTFREKGLKGKRYDIKLVLLTTYGAKTNAEYNRAKISKTMTLDNLFVEIPTIL
ncbi:MAG: ATP-binding protein [Sulfurimonas sp.]|jgi:hypothetical protein